MCPPKFFLVHVETLIIVIKLSIICNRAMLVSKGHEEEFIQWPFLKTLPSPANWGNEHHSEENVRRLKCSDAFRRGFPWFQLPEISIFEENILVLHLKVFFLNPQFLKRAANDQDPSSINMTEQRLCIFGIFIDLGIRIFLVIFKSNRLLPKIEKYLYKTLTIMGVT